MTQKLVVTFLIVAIIVAISNYSGIDTTTVAAAIGMILSIYLLLSLLILRARVNLISWKLKLNEPELQGQYLNELYKKE